MDRSDDFLPNPSHHLLLPEEMGNIQLTEFGYILAFFAGAVGGLIAGIIFHELGHVLAALLLGWRIHKVTIGRGRTIWHFPIGRTRVEWRQWLFAGRVYAMPTGSGNAWATSIFLLAGIMFNLVLFFVALSFIWHQSMQMRWLALGLAASQLILVMGSLFPHSTQVDDSIVHSDGKLLKSVIFNPVAREQVFREILLRPYLSHTSTSGSAGRLNSGIVQHAASVAFQDSESKGELHYAFMQRELKGQGLSTEEELYLIDATLTSWLTHNPQNHLDDMTRLMDRAMAIGGDLKTIRQTRGAFLVQLGRFSDAKEQILQSRSDTDTSYEAMLNAYFLARTHLGLGETAEAARQAEAMSDVLRLFDAGANIRQLHKSLLEAIDAATRLQSGPPSQ